MQPLEIPYWFVRLITNFDESIYDTCDLIKKIIRAIIMYFCVFTVGAAFGFGCYVIAAGFAFTPIFTVGLALLFSITPMIVLIIVAALNEVFNYFIQNKGNSENMKQSKIKTLWKSFTGKICVPIRVVRKNENYNDQEG